MCNGHANRALVLHPSVPTFRAAIPLRFRGDDGEAAQGREGRDRLKQKCLFVVT
jgi:hypothetical protein